MARVMTAGCIGSLILLMGTTLALGQGGHGDFDSLTVNGMGIANANGKTALGRVVPKQQAAITTEDVGAAWAAADVPDASFYMMDMSANGKYQTIAVLGGSLMASDDYGRSWTAVGPDPLFWLSVAMSSDGRMQAAAGYINATLHISTDYGQTWTDTGFYAGGYGLDMSADGRIITAPQPGGVVMVSTDGGTTWTGYGATRNWADVAMSADGRIQTCTVHDGANMHQLYTSTDYGQSWTARGDARRYWQVAVSADGKHQTATTWGTQLYVSSDYGETWSGRAGSAQWNDVSVSSDGKIQVATKDGGQIYISKDYGETWNAVASNRQWQGIAMSADGQIITATVYGGVPYTCYATTDILGDLTVNGKKVALADGSQPMTGNLQTGGNYLSGDGDNEGLRITDDGTGLFSNGLGLGIFKPISADGSSGKGLCFDSSGNAAFLQDIFVSQYIRLLGDSDNMQFTDNRFRFNVDDRTLLDVHATAQNYVKLGDGLDVDIDLNGMMLVEGSSGNVGIGTTSPRAKLEVAESIRIVGDPGYVRATAGSAGPNAPGGAYLQGVIDAENSYSRAVFSHNAYWDPDANEWKTHAIGANDASAILVPNGGGLYFINHASTENADRTFTHGQFVAGTKMAVKNDGNVGIGTTSPAEKLEVAGNVKATGTGRFEQGITYVAPLGDIEMGDFDQE